MPTMLDVVHACIDSTKMRFSLTGLSPFVGGEALLS